MNNLVKVGNENISVVEWKGQRVITTALLAEVYETSVDNVKMNFSRHKDNFIEGTHYFLLQGEELKAFKNLVTDSYLVDKRTPQLYLWTERGANRHCKKIGEDIVCTGMKASEGKKQRNGRGESKCCWQRKYG